MKEENRNAILLIGGNMGNRLKYINQAKDLLMQNAGNICAQSSIIESAPWGFESESNFLNQILEIKTNLNPYELLKICQEIENRLMRIRNEKQYISRTMDIDILFIGNLIMEDPILTLPHPRLHKRKFTLLPLAELYPDFVHPCLKKTMKELFLNCEDSSEVSIFEGSI